MIGHEEMCEQQRSPHSQPYRMGRRAEQVEQTRQRFVEAKVALRGSIRLAASTIAAIACAFLGTAATEAN